MPEARDRLSRPVDIAEIYSRRRYGAIGDIEILANDEYRGWTVNQTPFRWGTTPLTGGGAQRPTGVAPPSWTSTAAATRGGGAGGGLFVTPRAVHRRRGRGQNTPPSGSNLRRSRGSSGGSNSVLPSWYRRMPLGDITPVVRAIERSRALLGEGEGQLFRSPIMARQQLTVGCPSSVARLEQEGSLQTPTSVKKYKPSPLGKVPKILAEFANQGDKESELLTPQKKLLDSIDIVEKVVMEELQRLKRTPTARKEERERKVRTLMSMR